MNNLNSCHIAVIGSGYWGKNLVRNFSELGSLSLICDKDEVILAGFKEQYPQVETCLALTDVLSRDTIDGVVIATPAETHFSVAREALLAEKHVFVEKPLSLTEEAANELVELSERKRLTLMVGHLLQYHPVFAKLKSIAASGELGRINYIYSHRLNLGKIRREENILWSFAPHDISMILSMAGEEPESILATGGNYLHNKIADVTTTHLEFPSGLRSQVFVSWLHPFKEQRLVVIGDRKMAVFCDTLPWPNKLLLYPHKIKWQDSIPVPNKAEAERFDIPQSEPLRVECEHFLECMMKGKRPISDGYEGLRVLRVLNASQRSLDSQGKRVFLKIKEDAYRDDSSIEHKDRQKIESRYQSEGAYFVHDSAVVDEKVSIGRDTKIWHFSHILSGTTIGEKCNIGQNVVIGPDVTIGNGCKIQNNVSVYKGVTLEKWVFCGPSMVFTNVYNPRAEIRKMNQLRTTLVRKGVTIGANATIICGITVGKYAFIGAGAVVNRDVLDYALVVGNPAKQIGWMCHCGEQLSHDLECVACGKTYRKKDETIEESGST